MNNKDIQKYYSEMAKNIQNPHETRNKAKDFTKYDVQFMKRFANKNSTLLDLGSGTGLLINNLVDDYKKIIAVEKYPEFSRFITKHKNINVINDDILNFNIKEPVNIVTLFGVIQYFNLDEAKSIYGNIYNMLSSNGVLIVKHQMGLSEDVIVDGWSEELQTNYYSQYRNVDTEIELLKNFGFKEIEKFDIYPSEYNRWDNTHFYALVCKK